jgi:hypothetical protein
LSGIPKNSSKALAAVGTIGAAWSALNLLGQVRNIRASGATGAALGWAAVSLVGLVSNAYVTTSSIRDLQARKKGFTRYVVVDKDGQEIGWSYDLAASRRQARAAQARGARLIPVQVRVDYAEVQQFLRTKAFQSVGEVSL